ncbi:MAG: heat-inducible transcriptional repressor HrcA [Candidatus Latescibacteria bacterium]|jgi:heat-inducible transcriptional repressor|nr:heat-inducible transcriptional repressor HrcA [Candidatus Latescibacterota bacterium]
MDTLAEREAEILELMIKAHVATGEPVGSRTISKTGIGLSAATVRNSMADLEEKGYLTHPFTSAGRLPTDRGYRFYVDKLMAQEELEEDERQHIRERIAFRVREGNIEGVLEQVSRVIGELSLNLGVALTPRFERGVFERLEMVHLSESKILLVLTIASGLVKTMVIEVDARIAHSELDETARAINERLSGLSVAEIRDSVGERLRSISRGSPRLLRALCDTASTLFRASSGDDLRVGGTGNFFLQPEFSGDQKSVAALLDLLEERNVIVTILDERMDNEGIAITIGNEHGAPELHNCSVLTSRYRVGDVSGLVGVIGPTRIPYAKMVPMLRYVTHVTEEMLAQ